MSTPSIDEQLREIKTLLLSQKTVLNFEEVVAYTGLSRSWLYKMTSKGLIPCSCPTGKLLYFEKEKIDCWLLQNKKKSNDDLDTEANTRVALKK